MTQLTLRGFEPELLRSLQELARRQRTSLNKAALTLMRRGAGLEGREEEPGTIGSSLDHLFGTWSAEEAREFEQATASFGDIDPEMWQ